MVISPEIISKPYDRRTFIRHAITPSTSRGLSIIDLVFERLALTDASTVAIVLEVMGTLA